MQADHEHERDQALMGVGKQCSASSCQLVDFLPIKCDHCREPFCSEHYKPTMHSCKEWNELKADRRALECPQCEKLISIPPGNDPNILMNAHLDSECPGVPGVAEASSTPVCNAPRCQKKLVMQAIECKDCKKKFCASHYHPASHKCTTASSSAPKSMLSKMTAAKSAAALAALERVKNSKPLGSSAGKPSIFAKVKPAVPMPSASTSASSSNSKSDKPGNNPFSSRDRHAKEERASQLKAMKDKIDKGLITDPEEIKRFEQMKADYEAKNECILM